MNIETGLSLGCNLGDRLANMAEAKRRILALPGVLLAAQSPVYETDPVGVKPEYQHLKFLNAILVVSSPLVVHEWFDQLRAIENGMGRQRGMDRYAPRSIDIDIVYAGERRIESGGLVIPHPRWKDRRFVVQPLADVRPDLVLPGETLPVSAILEALPRKENATLLTREW